MMGTACAIAVASTAMSGALASAATHTPARPAVTPTSAVVGTGTVTCKTATGEVGYSPASQTGATGTLTVSIWFKATGCVAASANTTPVPTSVIASMSFTRANGCPLLGPLGTGTLNMAYNYPNVAATVIDPSVGQQVTVTQSGPYWVLAGTIGGSYPSTTFSATLKPDPIAGQTCGSGLTSEYIIRDQTPFIANI
jgi:hypothetical protein